MVPTEAGGLYLQQARESVRHAWLGVDRVRAFVRAQFRDLPVAYSTYLNTRLLDVIQRLAIRSMQVTRDSLSTRQAVSGVLRGNLHAGFGSLPILEADISSRLLFEEPLLACFPVGQRLAAKSTIQLEDLENLQGPSFNVCGDVHMGVFADPLFAQSATILRDLARRG